MHREMVAKAFGFLFRTAHECRNLHRTWSLGVERDTRNEPELGEERYPEGGNNRASESAMWGESLVPTAASRRVAHVFNGDLD